MMVDVIKELKLKCDGIECGDRETCHIYKFLQYESLTISIDSDTKQNRFIIYFCGSDDPYYHMDIGVCPNWRGIRRNV